MPRNGRIRADAIRLPSRAGRSPACPPTVTRCVKRRPRTRGRWAEVAVEDGCDGESQAADGEGGSRQRGSPEAGARRAARQVSPQGSSASPRGSRPSVSVSPANRRGRHGILAIGPRRPSTSGNASQNEFFATTTLPSPVAVARERSCDHPDALRVPLATRTRTPQRRFRWTARAALSKCLSHGFSSTEFSTRSTNARAAGVNAPPVTNTIRCACSGTLPATTA